MKKFFYTILTLGVVAIVYMSWTFIFKEAKTKVFDRFDRIDSVVTNIQTHDSIMAMNADSLIQKNFNPVMIPDTTLTSPEGHVVNVVNGYPIHSFSECPKCVDEFDKRLNSILDKHLSTERDMIDGLLNSRLKSR